MANSLKADGSWGTFASFGRGLGHALAVKALQRAAFAGEKVDPAAVRQVTAALNATPGANLPGNTLQLYDAASRLGVLQDAQLIEAAAKARRVKGKLVGNAKPAPNAELDQAFARVVQDAENNPRFLLGFGNLGGEEFISHMLVSEALALRGKEPWNQWQNSVGRLIASEQNADGSWTGRHCISGTTVPTAGAVLTMLSANAPQQLGDAKALVRASQRR